MVVAIVTSVMISTGFWTWFNNRSSKHDAKTDLLLGLAHGNVVSTGQAYIARGWVTYDEYEDFMKYLFEPYSKFGGNGLAEKIAGEVKKLPIVRSTGDPLLNKELKKV